MLLELPHGKSHVPDPRDRGDPARVRALCGKVPPAGRPWTVFPDETPADIPATQLCGRCRGKMVGTSCLPTVGRAADRRRR